jgi:hypothetical protein
LVKWLGSVYRYGAIRIAEEKEQKAKSGRDVAFHLVSYFSKKCDRVNHCKKIHLAKLFLPSGARMA